MCRLLTHSSDWISLSSWEIEQGGFVDFPQVTTYHASYLRKQFPDKNLEVMYVCGSGNGQHYILISIQK